MANDLPVGALYSIPGRRFRSGGGSVSPCSLQEGGCCNAFSKKMKEKACGSPLVAILGCSQDALISLLDRIRVVHFNA